MGNAGGNAVAAAGIDDPERQVPAGAGENAARLVQVVRPPALRLPLMEKLVDGWPAEAGARLVRAWSLAIGFRRAPIGTQLAGELIETFDETALIGRFGPAGAGFLAIERSGVFLLLDAILGGGGKLPGEAAMMRPLTMIEQGLMQPLALHIVSALCSCLQPAGTLDLPFRGWCRSRAEAADAAGGGVLVLPLVAEWQGQEATLTLALPLALIEPMLPVLGGVYPGPALGADAGWRRHMAREVGRARTVLTAVLAEASMPLSRITALAVGETLAFDVAVDPAVRLVSGGLTLATGRLGRSNGRIAVRLETPVRAGREERP